MATRCLYQASADDLAAAIAEGRLVPAMEKAFKQAFGHEPHSAEVRSWRNSIPTVVDRLVAAGLGGVQVLLEMKNPITDIRMDMVLIGSSPERDRMAVVVIENKQWSQMSPVPGSELVQVDYAQKQWKIHPVNQVWGYRQVLIDFIPLLRNADVYCIANMHNAPRSVLSGIAPTAQGLSDAVVMSSHARMYGAGEEALFERALQRCLAPDKAKIYADELLEAPVRPTENFMTTVSEDVGGRPIFTLLDEQREAYDYVRSLVTKSGGKNRKEAVLVIGGPGTGKSVIAVELVGALSRQGVSVVHTTGSKAFTTTLRERIGSRPLRTRRVFGYFNDFINALPNNLEVLIADEAHRIRKHSGRKGAPPPDRSQIEELISAARVPVFLLDEHQLVRRDEVGSVQLIKEAAQQLDVDVHTIDLRHEFRCGGSPAYLEWVDRLFEIRPGEPPQPWNPVDDFELFVAASPQVMEDYLKDKNTDGRTARIAAGFCWEWSRPRRDGSLVDDVKIGNWHRPWNVGGESRVGGAPQSSLWATDKGGFGQVGCIYTAQGFEYDYAGVIIGPDLVWNGDGWRTDRRANMDSQVKSAPKFDELVRNTYRVLATRGLRGAVFYSTDADTNRFLAHTLGVPILRAT